MDWQTPDPVLELVRAVAPIGLDPCGAPSNPTKARFFYAPGGASTGAAGWLGPDGLRCANWTDVEPFPQSALMQSFWNPRYGAFLSGEVEPDREVWRKNKAGERVHVGTGTGWAAKWADFPVATSAGKTLLVPVRTETAWWKRCFYASRLVLLWSSPTLGVRIAFVDPRTGKPVSGSNLASTVFYDGPDPARFAAVFAPHGTLIKGGK